LLLPPSEGQLGADAPVAREVDPDSAAEPTAQVGLALGDLRGSHGGFLLEVVCAKLEEAIRPRLRRVNPDLDAAVQPSDAAPAVESGGRTRGSVVRQRPKPVVRAAHANAQQAGDGPRTESADREARIQFIVQQAH